MHPLAAKVSIFLDVPNKDFNAPDALVLCFLHKLTSVLQFFAAAEAEFQPYRLEVDMSNFKEKHESF